MIRIPLLLCFSHLILPDTILRFIIRLLNGTNLQIVAGILIDLDIHAVTDLGSADGFADRRFNADIIFCLMEQEAIRRQNMPA